MGEMGLFDFHHLVTICNPVASHEAFLHLNDIQVNYKGLLRYCLAFRLRQGTNLTCPFKGT